MKDEYDYKIAVCYITHTKYKTLPPKYDDVDYDVDNNILDEFTNDDPYYEVLDGWGGECLEQFGTYEEAQEFIRQEKEKTIDKSN